MQRKARGKNSSLKKFIVADRYDGMELGIYVKTVMGVSARQRQKLFYSKGVYVNGSSAHTGRLLKAGDMVAIRQFKDSSYGVLVQEGPVKILYEDEQLIVLNKPAGMLVHPAGRTANGTLANYLAGYFSSRKKIITVRAIHRLDRDTTGCVVFAKTAKMQTRLEQMLSEGKIHREYLAVICGDGNRLAEELPEGRIDLPIGKDISSPNRRVVTRNGQRAVTHFRVERASAQLSLLSLWLETGRTHQIRVHLAHCHYPVLGDRMYGSSSRILGRQALHAAAVELVHPVSGEKIRVEAPMPGDLADIVERI